MPDPYEDPLYKQKSGDAILIIAQQIKTDLVGYSVLVHRSQCWQF